MKKGGSVSDDTVFVGGTMSEIWWMGRLMVPSEQLCCRNANKRGYNRPHINSPLRGDKMASKGTHVDGDTCVSYKL